MSIGYACLAVGVPDTDIKSCMLKNATEEKLVRLIRHNLSSLKNIIDYNVMNSIRLFRISSDIIPFGSYPGAAVPWKRIFRDELSKIGKTIAASGIRVSMHPGQYTVLNSPDEAVARRAAEDLLYHAAFLSSLGAGVENKIILHAGGAYGDKKAALRRFERRFEQRFLQLDESVRERLAIENDDKIYNIGDVLELGSKLGLPVVYDNLHNFLNSCDHTKDDYYWVSQCASTWKESDGRQKIHYSQQSRSKKSGSHSDSVSINEFLDFYAGLGENMPDIMLEVKDKNLSAVKCISCTAQSANISTLEGEWSRYKYAVLEKSPNIYKQIRELLKDKSTYPAIAFYNAVESAYEKDYDKGSCVNAALHVWGYFKNSADKKEKMQFTKLLKVFENAQTSSAAAIKRFLYKLAIKYKQDYLLNSYYFLNP